MDFMRSFASLADIVTFRRRLSSVVLSEGFWWKDSMKLSRGRNQLLFITWSQLSAQCVAISALKDSYLICVFASGTFNLRQPCVASLLRVWWNQDQWLNVLHQTNCYKNKATLRFRLQEQLTSLWYGLYSTISRCLYDIVMHSPLIAFWQLKHLRFGLYILLSLSLKNSTTCIYSTFIMINHFTACQVIVNIVIKSLW